TRVGQRMGTPIEDLGTVPDNLHYMTKSDLLNGNTDLINHAVSILAKMPVRELSTEVNSAENNILTCTIKTKNISRLDIFIDNRPQQSLDINDGTTQLTIKFPEDASTLDLQGYDKKQLVAACRKKLGSGKELKP
ncbi:MAG: hypothetical protein ACYT04_49245, partial [Nostoc sp.]